MVLIINTDHILQSIAIQSSGKEKATWNKVDYFQESTPRGYNTCIFLPNFCLLTIHNSNVTYLCVYIGLGLENYHMYGFGQFGLHYWKEWRIISPSWIIVT
jgi:hypothetical protein